MMKNMSMFKKLTVICFLMLFSLSFISPLIPTADAFINIDLDPKEVGEAVIDGAKWVYDKVKGWITGSDECNEKDGDSGECDKDDEDSGECDKDDEDSGECDKDDEDDGDGGGGITIIINIHVYDGGQVILDQK